MSIWSAPGEKPYMQFPLMKTAYRIVYRAVSQYRTSLTRTVPIPLCGMLYRVRDVSQNITSPTLIMEGDEVKAIAI